MTDLSKEADLSKEGERLYREGVTEALGGFQLLEDALKTYLGWHFDAVRKTLDGRLHFEFQRQDYQQAALGRLVNVFSKCCANIELTGDLRSIVNDRDHVAHQALLRIYPEDGLSLSPEAYLALIQEIEDIGDRLRGVLNRVVDEMRKLPV